MQPEEIKTTLAGTGTPALFEKAVQEAAEQLRRGALVALPTETVYGLAANAFDPEAVARIFKAKGRPQNNPLIVHVASREMAARCVKEWPDLAEKLAEAFWPGPLTLVLPRSDAVPSIVTAGGPTVALRWPAHPLMQAVIRACDFPLAAPSANLSNRTSPTTAEHVLRQLSGRVPLVVDGGQCQVGIESTVLDLTVSPPRLLRPGMIHEDSLKEITPVVIRSAVPDQLLKSPGMLRKHYSPAGKLVIWEWSDNDSLRKRVEAAGFSPSSTAILAHSNIPQLPEFARVAVIPRDAEAFARAFYGELHECDARGIEAIVVEQPPDGPEWAGILDRLARASAD